MCIYTDEHTNALSLGRPWGHLAAPPLQSSSLPSPRPIDTSTHPRHKYRKRCGGHGRHTSKTASRHSRLVMWTHPWSVIRAWCRDSDLELIKGEVSLAEPSAKPFKRVQEPPHQRDALLSLKTQPPGLLHLQESEFYQQPPPTRPQPWSTLSLQPCQSRQRTQLVSTQTVAHRDYEMLSVCTLNHWLSVQHGRVMNARGHTGALSSQSAGHTYYPSQQPYEVAIKFPC